MSSAYKCFHCGAQVGAGASHNCGAKAHPMTHSTQDDALVEVTQADREAAEAFFPLDLWKDEARADVAQAFARHRIAVRKAALDEAEEAVRNAISEGWGHKADDAIRALAKDAQG